MLKEKEVAIHAVKQAVKIAMLLQDHLASDDILEKEDLSPVTVCDFSCQAVINCELAKHFPQDAMRSEESFATLIPHAKFREKVCKFANLNENELAEIIDYGKNVVSDRFWTLDPIDGTKGLIRKEHYAIGLALIERGEVVLAVMATPRLKRAIFVAEKGRGTFLNDDKTPLKIKEKTHEMIYCEPNLYSKSHSHSKAEKIAQKLHTHATSCKIDSQAKYAMIVLGEASIYLRIPKTDRKEKIWDHAPGVLIVEEAGGVVTDLRGERLNFTTGVTMKQNVGVLATTGGKLHSQAIAAAKEVLKL